MNNFNSSATMPAATHEALNLPPQLRFRKPTHLTNNEARQLRHTFCAYLQENFPKAMKIKCNIVPSYSYVFARARYKNRSIYTRAYNLHDCIANFAQQYNTKVLLC